MFTKLAEGHERSFSEGRKSYLGQLGMDKELHRFVVTTSLMFSRLRLLKRKLKLKWSSFLLRGALFGFVIGAV